MSQELLPGFSFNNLIDDELKKTSDLSSEVLLSYRELGEKALKSHSVGGGERKYEK